MAIMALRLMLWTIVFLVSHTGYMLKFALVFIPEAAIAWWIGRLYDQSTFYSKRDILTGVYNRYFTDAMLPTLISKAERSGQPLCVLMVDVDKLKLINDGDGHKVGDRVIQQVAHTLLDSTGKSDFVSRWGGDEFLLVLLDTDGAGAWAVVDRIRSNLVGVSDGFLAPLSVSIGVAVYPMDGRTLDALLDLADARMYADKQERMASAWSGSKN